MLNNVLKGPGSSIGLAIMSLIYKHSDLKNG